MRYFELLLSSVSVKSPPVPPVGGSSSVAGPAKSNVGVLEVNFFSLRMGQAVAFFDVPDHDRLFRALDQATVG